MFFVVIKMNTFSPDSFKNKNENNEPYIRINYAFLVDLCSALIN